MRKFLLSVETDGLAVFDPILLSDFIKSNKLTDRNIFHSFVKKPEVGDRAISEGVVLPVYPIASADYLIGFSDGEHTHEIKREFSYADFPLKCETGTLVVTDIFALMDWEDEFFRNYHAFYEDRSATNDMVQVAPGLYSVSLIGGWQTTSSNEKVPVYDFVLNGVAKLPERDEDKDIESYDFKIHF